MPLGGADGGPRLRYYLRQRKARLSWPTGSSAAAGPSPPPPPPLPRINEDLRNCTWLRVASSRAIGLPLFGADFPIMFHEMSVLKLQNTFLVVSVACVRGLCETWGRGVRRCAVAAWPKCGPRDSRTNFTLFRVSLSVSAGSQKFKYRKRYLGESCLYTTNNL